MKDLSKLIENAKLSKEDHGLLKDFAGFKPKKDTLPSIESIPWIKDKLLQRKSNLPDPINGSEPSTQSTFQGIPFFNLNMNSNQQNLLDVIKRMQTQGIFSNLFNRNK